MAVKKVIVPDIGTVHFYKRRGNKSIRLSVTHKGDIRVSLPMWVPYRLGVEFVLKKQSWLTAKQRPNAVLADGQRIGKEHYLVFSYDTHRDKIATRLMKDGQIKILLPISIAPERLEAQKAAKLACIRALKRETEDMLPTRLRSLSRLHNLPFKSVNTKQLYSRWGSCSEQKDIVINCFLIQLPWHLIDYVLLHELMHTKIMSHGTVFWDELAKHVSNLPQIRKEMRQYRPILLPLT